MVGESCSRDEACNRERREREAVPLVVKEEGVASNRVPNASRVDEEAKKKDGRGRCWTGRSR